MQFLQKKNVKEHSVLFKECSVLFSIYIYIYLTIYIEKRTEGTFSRSFAKERNVLAFFYVLCKRMLRSLCSFLLFAKENRRSLRSFGSHKSPKTRKKRTEKNGTVLLKNGTYRTEKNSVFNPAQNLCRFKQMVEYLNKTKCV